MVIKSFLSVVLKWASSSSFKVANKLVCRALSSVNTRLFSSLVKGCFNSCKAIGWDCFKLAKSFQAAFKCSSVIGLFCFSTTVFSVLSSGLNLLNSDCTSSVFKFLWICSFKEEIDWDWVGSLGVGFDSGSETSVGAVATFFFQE